MSPIRDQAELEAMRKRLYERGASAIQSERGTLSDITPIVQRSWEQPPVPAVPPPEDPRTETLTEPTIPVTHTKVQKKTWSYRSIILLITVGLFLLVLGGTGLYLYLGNNQISNKNIDLTISGPLTVGGGEAINLEVKIDNNNKVPIEGAVLIVNLPSGTKTNDETARDLLEERISVGTVAAGEEYTVPLSAVVFGEENQEREIKATIEYRVVGSSGTFYKEADPLTFTVISSPVVIRVKSLNKVSAGQEVEVELTVQSNTETPLRDILITADYPTNFDYSSSVPAPAYRESAWLIEELRPEKSATIKIRGAIIGKQSEEFQMKFTAGTAQPGNQFAVGSILANAAADFEIEQPFINVGIGVNGVESEVVTLKTGDQTAVVVSVRNTLTDTLYDMAVEVGIKGNILVRDRVNVQRGFYDSVKDVIRFDPSGDSSLTQVAPGELKQFTFNLRPSDRTETPAFTVTANAFARRVAENNATEQLVGTAKSEVKFTSSVDVSGEVGRGNTTFVESGPFPPVADVATTYTITLFAGAGGNDVTGAVLTTALPQYVSWQNQNTGDGTVLFNPISKEITWNIGDIEAGARKQLSFQVALLPSQNQIGSTPALLSAQRFRATDRFTGDVVRAEAAPLSTELSTEAGFDRGNGVIRRTAGADAE